MGDRGGGMEVLLLLKGERESLFLFGVREGDSGAEPDAVECLIS